MCVIEDGEMNVGSYALTSSVKMIINESKAVLLKTTRLLLAATKAYGTHRLCVRQFTHL